MSGGICGLTQEFDIYQPGFWYRNEDGDELNPCSGAVSSSELTECLSGEFTEYWKYFQTFFL